MQRRIRQVYTSVKEHTCVNYAKMAPTGGFSDLDLILIKATSPDDLPLPDKYIHQLLKIFSLSPSSYQSFSLSFTRRFIKTQCWRVALKCLVILHRLLRSLPDNSPFRAELLRARSNGLLSLHPCHFRDFSCSVSDDSDEYTFFIRSYAHLLDEALDSLSIENKIDEEKEELETFPDKMKELGRMLEVLPQAQSLIDRVMNCKPIGVAAKSFLVQSTMKYIIRDSFICYTTFRKEIVVVIEHLIQMPYASCIRAFQIYKKARVQADQLCEFYDWCKSMGLCGVYEYPFIDKIPEIQIQALENFLNGMWQLTESSSSSTTTPLMSTTQSPLSSTDGNGDKQLMRADIFSSTNKAKFEEENNIPKKPEKDEEIEPLIKFEVENNVDWESLLEASITPPRVASKNYNLHPIGHGYGYAYNSENERVEEVNRWQMQIYNPHGLNPFDQSLNMMSPSNPTYPWGL